MMTFGSLFAGIGGFDLGLERAGMRCEWQVEIDPYCQRVLAKHWHGVKRYSDIRTVHGINIHPHCESKSASTIYAEMGLLPYGIKCDYCLTTVDLICGGFPCQPFSVTGQQRGTADDRHLWPEMLRVIREVRPSWVLGENVAGIIPMELDTVLSDLEDSGYETQTLVIPACAVDAPHRRDRVWIVAHSDGRDSGPGEESYQQRVETPDGCQDVAESCVSGFQDRHAGENRQRPYAESSGENSRRDWAAWATEPQLGRVAHGIPRRVDRLKSLGNAVVPQVVEVIGRAIMAVEAGV